MRYRARRLRKEVFRYEAGGEVQRTTVDDINKLMASYPVRTRLMRREGGFRTEAYSNPAEPEDLLGPVGYSIAALYADLDPTRIRKCSNCVLHFYDTSKKGTRRWCSMQMCGNRAKVATYAARHRG